MQKIKPQRWKRLTHSYTEAERPRAVARAKLELLRMLDRDGSLRPAAEFQWLHGKGWSPYVTAQGELVAARVIRPSRSRYVVATATVLAKEIVVAEAELRSAAYTFATERPLVFARLGGGAVVTADATVVPTSAMGAVTMSAPLA